jgi:hypothetical protein
MIVTKRAGNCLRIIITDEHGVRFDRLFDRYSALPIRSQRAFLEPAVDFFNGREVSTQKSVFDKFCLLGLVIQSLRWTDLPKTETHWQSAVLDLYSGWLTLPGARLDTRVQSWNGTIRPHLNFLRDVADIIPLSVMIPSAKSKVSADDLKGYRGEFIGEDGLQPVVHDVKKLILPISLSRGDAAYLDEVRDELAHRRTLLDACCVSWWAQIDEHFRYGQEHRKAVNLLALNKQLADGKTREFRAIGNSRGMYHFANGDSEESLGKLLAIVTEHHGGKLNKNLLERTAELPVLAAITLPKSAPTVVSPLVTKSMRLNWMLGHVSVTDLSIGLTLLTMRNPKFTQSALTTAKVTDKSGKRYLEFGDLGISFRVLKRRAHSIKTSTLDDQSSRVLQLILEMTEPRRAELAAAKSSFANMLCLVKPDGTYRFLLGHQGTDGVPSNHWIGSYFPKLADAGMTVGTLSLTKVRATEGVLEWFRTGSVAAMARKLGNSTQVCIEHYLPPALLRAWDVRLLRRFQNLFIAVASAGESYQLAVTDFTTLQELHAFLADMLRVHPNGSSPLANELHNRMGAINIDLDAAESYVSGSKRGQLAVAASPTALLSLYLYQESAIAAGVSPKILEMKEASSGISPRQIIAIAELVRTRAQDDRNPAIRAAHEKALRDLPEALKRSEWSTLIAAWGCQYAA